jgi:hypothetical protein
MNAREKLNAVMFVFVLGASALTGVCFQSSVLFVVSFVFGLILSVQMQGIRPGKSR